MPCKIQIKQNLENTIDTKTKNGIDMSLEQSIALANAVNKEFRTKVVEFPEEGKRKINVPNSLIDKYYDFEKKLEANDFVNTPRDSEIMMTAKSLEKLDKLSDFSVYKEGDVICSSGICNLTSRKATQALIKAGLDPYHNNANGDTLSSSFPSPVGDFMIGHYFASVIIDGRAYIYDKPQSEFVDFSLFTKELVDITTPYKPRLIALTLESIEENYGVSTKQAGRIIKSILNTNPPKRTTDTYFNTVLNPPTYKEYIQKKVDNADEYIDSLEEQIKVAENTPEEQRLLYGKKVDPKIAKEVMMDDIAAITPKDESKIIKYLRTKLYTRVRAYLPRTVDNFKLSTLFRELTGLDFKYNNNQPIQESIDKAKEYIGSEKFIDELKGNYRRELVEINSINNLINSLYEAQRIALSYLNYSKGFTRREAFNKFSFQQQAILNSIFSPDVLKDKKQFGGEVSPQGEISKSWEVDTLYIEAKRVSNINNIIKSMNVGFNYMIKGSGKRGAVTMDDLVLRRFKAHAKFNKARTILQYANAMEGDVSYIHEALERETHRRYAFFANKGDTSYQTDNMHMSKADDATIERVKMVAKKMGVSFTTLGEYLKGNPEVNGTGINALADQFKGIVAIALGKEAEAITEETVHIASAILEQTNPELITALISQIGKFKIYKKTLAAYKGKKAYQLANGKPDIRKIKREAVDKLITEVIVQESPDSESNPELLSLTILEQIKNWWKQFLSAIRGNYSLANIDMFETAASLIMDDKVDGNFGDIKNKDIYYQTGGNTAVDALYDTINEKAKEIVGPIPETGTKGQPGYKKRHYTFKGNEVDFSVTEKIKGNVVIPNRTPKQAFRDNEAKNWGSEGHEFLHKNIVENFIDDQGYALPKFTNNPIDTKLPKKVRDLLHSFAGELISSYPPGTRFQLEKNVINESGKETLASMIDFVAIVPKEDENGEQKAKAEILDWKFTAFDETYSDDVPWYKQRDWKSQMVEYAKIITNYGISASDITKARMIPFKMTYKDINSKDYKKGTTISKIQIGDLNNLKEAKTYLLPVAIDAESTGYDLIDELLSGLRAEHRKIFNSVVDEADRETKNRDLNEIAKAIRLLHMKLDFKPLLSVANNYLKNATKLVESLKGVDYSTLSEEEINAKLKDIIEAKESANKYVEITRAFQLVMDPNDAGDKILLNRFAALDVIIEDLLTDTTKQKRGAKNPSLGQLQAEYAMQLSIILGLSDEKHKTEVLSNERAINKLSKSFLEASKLPAYLVHLGVNMIGKVKNLVNFEYNDKMAEFKKVLIPLEKLASAQGKKAFYMIAKKTEKGLELYKKLDSGFIQEVQEAKAAKDKAFFKKNMDTAKYKKVLKEALEENEKKILSRNWYPLDIEANKKRKEVELAKLRNRLNIERDGFNGYSDKYFMYLFYNSIVEEDHYSEEFTAIKNQPETLAAWEFFTELNEEAKKLGYLDKHSLSFFPLMEATMLERLHQTDNLGGEARDLFGDTYKMRINERQNLAKVNPETGLVDRTIPKYYTATDKQVNQLSTNLDMVGSMWIHAILEYKAAKNLEFSLLTLLDVEKSKQNLAVANGQLIFQGGKPMSEKKDNENIAPFQAIIDDAVYFIKEDLNSWGAQKVASASELGAKSGEQAENRAVSAKKAIRTADKLVHQLAIGLKPLIGIANWFGIHMQTFINSGNFYNFAEFEKYHAQILTNTLTKEQKALLHLVMPLDNLVGEARRGTAREQGSLIKWLSTWSFTEAMMATNSWPDRQSQFASSAAMNKNSMVVDGKIVNIRQHLAAEDRKIKYKPETTVAQRKALEKSFNSRVKALRETKGLEKVVQIIDDKIVIPGVDNKALADYRLKTIEYGRKLSGLMSEDNKMGYRRDTILSSFMMFRSWMPKHIGTRVLGINKNLELDEWEYGKTRLFAKLVFTLGMRSISTINNIIIGNEAGLAYMKGMVEAKRQSYFNSTGKKLTISDEEFYDLVRTELQNQMKELLVLVSVVALTLKVSAMEPPEDATPAEVNKYKYLAKMFNKMADEISFYYNPLSLDAFSKGSIMPSLQLTSKVASLFKHLWNETEGHIMDDEELIKGAHPTKYFLNLVPGASQFQNELLPLYWPELAKELGVRVTRESRR